MSLLDRILADDPALSRAITEIRTELVRLQRVQIAAMNLLAAEEQGTNIDEARRVLRARVGHQTPHNDKPENAHAA